MTRPTPIPADGATLFRSRLLDRLDQLPTATALCALPGAGKSTLVTHWARKRTERGDHVAWITAETDHTPVDLHARLHDVITDNEHRAECDAHATGDPTNSYQRCIQTITAQAEDQSTIVIIDRADAITNPETIGALCTLLQDTPHLHLVICSRRWHPLIETAQDHGLSINLINGHDLTATPHEIAQLAETMGHGPRPDLTDVHTHTGGWMLPTKLMLDTMHATSPMIGNEVANDYIRTVVIPAIPDQDTIAAAMRLALAKLITPIHITEVAAAMVNDADETPLSGADLIARLLRADLIRPHHQCRETWAISPILQGALETDYASQDVDECTAWHRKFASALVNSGDPGHLGAAAVHARAAQDWPFLIAMWNTANLALTHQHVDDLVTAYSRIPLSVLAEYPVLSVPAAVARAFEGRPQGVRAQQALLRAFHTSGEPLLEEETASAGQPSNLRLQLLSTTIMVNRLEGRYDRAVASATRLDQELAERERSTDRNPQPVPRAWVMHQWAQTLLLAGNGEPALALATKAFTAAHDLDTHTIAANIAADIALIHAIGGSTTDTEHWLETRAQYDTADQWMHYIASLPAHIARTLAALDRLDPDLAATELAHTEDDTGQAEMWPFIVYAITQHALMFGDPIIALTAIDRYTSLNPRTAAADGVAPRTLDRCRTDVYLALGEVNLAQRLLDDRGPEVPWLQVARARLHLICGDYPHALRVASASVWDSATMLRDRIDLLMIKAAASEAVGSTDSADQSFARAAAIAARLGTLRPFLLIDTETRNTLIKRSDITFDDDTLFRLDNSRQVYPAHANLVVLTDRELAVLYQLTRHKSWSDITHALVVAPSTVKKQILSMYAKLDVHDRDAALLRATRLGFLPEPNEQTADHD